MQRSAKILIENFLWATRLWVGRRKEPILGNVKKKYEKKNSGSDRFRWEEISHMTLQKKKIIINNTDDFKYY